MKRDLLFKVLLAVGAIAIISIAAMSCSEPTDVEPIEKLTEINGANLEGTYVQVEHYTQKDGVVTMENMDNVGRVATFTMTNEVEGVMESQGGSLGNVSRGFTIVPFNAFLARIDFEPTENIPSVGNTTSCYFKDGQLYLVNYYGSGMSNWQVFDKK